MPILVGKVRAPVAVGAELLVHVLSWRAPGYGQGFPGCSVGEVQRAWGHARRRISHPAKGLR